MKQKRTCMRVLVTGGAGYIGNVVVRQLVQSGIQVIVLDNLTTGRRESLPANVALEVGSFSDPGLLDRLLPKVEAVFHFAASIDVAESMLHPIRYFQQNVVSTMALLEAMIRHRVHKFIFSSTAAIYGIPHQIPVDEEHPKEPVNPYGESKLQIERTLEWLHQCYGLRYASLRYFNAAGGHCHGRATNLIPIVLEVARGLRPNLVVFGNDYPTRDGTAVRDYVHVEDLATAHLLTLDALNERSQLIYNLGNETGTTVLEVIETARHITEQDIPVAHAHRRPGDAPIVIASSQRIREQLGWSPQFSDLSFLISSAWRLSPVRLGSGPQ